MAKTPYISEICQFLVAFVLIQAAWGKLNTLKAFRDTLATAFKVPPTLLGFTSWAVITSEAALALALFSPPPYQLIVQWLIVAMFGLFSTILASAVIQGRIIHCHCFGKPEGQVTAVDVLRGGLLITAASIPLFTGEASSSRGINLTIIVLLAAALSIAIIQIKQIAYLLMLRNEGV